MSGDKVIRLSQVARKLNIGKNTILEFLAGKGFEVEDNPNSKISAEQYTILAKEFASSALDKEEALGLNFGKKHTGNIVIDSDDNVRHRQKEEEEEIFIKNLTATKEAEKEKPEKVPPREEKVEDEHPKAEKWVDETPKLQGIKVVGKIVLEETKSKAKSEDAEIQEEKKSRESRRKKETKKEIPAPEAETIPPLPVTKEEDTIEVIGAKADPLKGLTVLGKIDLTPKEKAPSEPVASSDEQKDKKNKRRQRKRIQKSKSPEEQKSTADPTITREGQKRTLKTVKEEPSEKEIQDQIRATMAKLSGGKLKPGLSRAKYRKEKRHNIAEAHEEKMLKEKEQAKILQVHEFISANDLASFMNVHVNEVISVCMGLGMFVSINQRLDAEAITIIADEFGFEVKFITEEENIEIETDQDKPEDLIERPPIVTIMGHVDHGKTSLLDYIRHSKVTEEEAGGITQHIGAYNVITDSGKRIAFLDTPGHEAFTAMRARGASITDVVIIVIAADDHVMPQTKEALNHAQVAGVPIVIAINKIDKPSANPEKIKEELSKINILVEDWGGKYQCQEISAKSGKGVNELLEKVLLEAELLELKANPEKPAVGTVIEAALDRGRGYVATVLVQEGSLKIGDIMLAGSHFGRVKAMTDHRGIKVHVVDPSTPVQVLGLDGAPQAGDKFHVMQTEREAREIALRRQQLMREQNLRTKKHITLDEIGRRLAIGNFKELNIIVKGDVDGSVEALSDSLLKLSTEQVQVNVIHKSVGQISESDVLLASASDAVVIGFQVRPSANARKLAEQEEIEIRLYSIIYDAINDLKDAMEGMLEPEMEEVILGNAEVRDVFKISKVGTVAGCMITEGVIKRNNTIRLIRDGIVVYTGEILALKRFKDDASEVKSGFECGISIRNFNDIKSGDIIESFEKREVKANA